MSGPLVVDACCADTLFPLKPVPITPSGERTRDEGSHTTRDVCDGVAVLTHRDKP